MNPTRWTSILFTLIGMIAWAGIARADADPKVNDDAHFFKPETIQKADSQLQQLKTETGVELVVETFPSIPDNKQSAYDAAKDDATQKEEFFSQWAKDRGRALKLYGVYILIVKSPGHLHVQAGTDTGRKAFPHDEQSKLSSMLLGEFKNKNYDEGLLKAIAEVKEVVQRNLNGQKLRSASAGHDPFPTASHTGGAYPPSNNSSVNNTQNTNNPFPAQKPASATHGMSCMWIVIVVVGVIVLFSFLRRSGANSNMGGGYGGNQGYGPPGTPGYGGGGYGPGPQRSGGGFMSGLFGGLLGGAAGSYVENKFENRNHGNTGGDMTSGGRGYTGGGAAPSDPGTGGDFGSSSSGSDFGSSGGDSGSGGDFGGGGGGDSGGGSSGGDF